MYEGKSGTKGLDLGKRLFVATMMPSARLMSAMTLTMVPAIKKNGYKGTFLFFIYMILKKEVVTATVPLVVVMLICWRKNDDENEGDMRIVK